MEEIDNINEINENLRERIINGRLLNLSPHWVTGFILKHKINKDKLIITISDGIICFIDEENIKEQTIEIPIDVDEHNIFIYLLDGELKYSIDVLPEGSNLIVLPLYIISIVNNNIKECMDYRGRSFEPVKICGGVEVDEKHEEIKRLLKKIEAQNEQINKNNKYIIELLNGKHKIKHKPIKNGN